MTNRPEEKTTCSRCGVEILNTTSERHGGMCVPCREGRRNIQTSSASLEHSNYHVVKPGRRLDKGCIMIEKDGENKREAFYLFRVGIWDKDPRFQSRSMEVGSTAGLLRIEKETGEINVLYPMSGDEHGLIASRAIKKLLDHWARREFPDRTLYATH